MLSRRIGGAALLMSMTLSAHASTRGEANCPPPTPIAKNERSMQKACAAAVQGKIERVKARKGVKFEVLSARAAPVNGDDFACLVVGKSNEMSYPGVYTTRLRYDNRANGGATNRAQDPLVEISGVIVQDLSRDTSVCE